MTTFEEASEREYGRCIGCYFLNLKDKKIISICPRDKVVICNDKPVIFKKIELKSILKKL